MLVDGGGGDGAQGMRRVCSVDGVGRGEGGGGRVGRTVLPPEHVVMPLSALHNGATQLAQAHRSSVHAGEPSCALMALDHSALSALHRVQA